MGNAPSLEQCVDMSGIDNAFTLKEKHMDEVLAGIKELFAYRYPNRILINAYVCTNEVWCFRSRGLQIDNLHREPDGRYRVVFDRVGDTAELFHFYLTCRSTEVAFLENSPGSGNYVGLYVHTSHRSLKEIFVRS